MNSEDLIAYLLHETAEEERLAFSQKWMSDPELHEQLKMAEAELLMPTSARKSGSAPAANRDLPARLGPAASEAIAGAIPAPGAASPAYNSLGAAIAAAACIVLAGGTAWLATENSRLNRQLAEARVEVERQRAAGPTFSLTLPNDAVRGAERETSLWYSDSAPRRSASSWVWNWRTQALPPRSRSLSPAE